MMMFRRTVTSVCSHTININNNAAACVSSQVRTVRRVPNKKVIIMKDHANLFENDIVTVKAGYMRNYLYPNGIAKYATQENLHHLSDSLTPQKQRDLEEKKKGDRVAKLLRAATVVEMTKPTKLQVVEAVGQRKELSKRIEPIELARIISDQFAIFATPSDILQVYQPDLDRVVTNFATDGIVLSGLYDVQLQTSKFTTGVVKFNFISVQDKEEIERLKQQRAENERVEREKEEERRLASEKRRAEAKVAKEAREAEAAERKKSKTRPQSRTRSNENSEQLNDEQTEALKADLVSAFGSGRRKDRRSSSEDKNNQEE